MNNDIAEQNSSRLVDDIEDIFKETAAQATLIKSMLYSCGCGNLVAQYRIFQQHFDYLFMLSSDHSHFENDPLIKRFHTWQRTGTITEQEIKKGLALFEEYKTGLFGAELLRWK